ncbi:MAG: enoyl-CoA hydratase/isomerase family protein [Bdellovibrionota bacterium]|jgi:enoyl-CoA hydratase
MNILEEDTVLVNEGVVAQVMINRPQALNAITVDIFQGLIMAFEKIERFPDLRVVTLWGAGDKAFAAGVEVNGYMDLGKRALAEYVELGNRALRTVERCKVPVIAAVNGYCFGAGLEVALAADVIVAGHSAQFGFPEVSLGAVPPFGGIARLVQRVGVGVAKKLLFSGEMIDAQEALLAHLVDEVAEPEKLTDTVNHLAETITTRAPLAVEAIKKIIREVSDNNVFPAIRRSIEVYLDLAKSSDWGEGADAFMQQRAPKFTGR